MYYHKGSSYPFPNIVITCSLTEIIPLTILLATKITRQKECLNSNVLHLSKTIKTEAENQYYQTTYSQCLNKTKIKYKIRKINYNQQIYIKYIINPLHQ